MTNPERGSRKKNPGNNAKDPCGKTDRDPDADRSDRIFLANLRERLRMPVNAVIEYSEMLLEDANKQGRADFIPDLMRIHSLGKNLLTLVDGSLDETTIIDEAMTDKEWDVFNANLRHELRTPLNAILGYSEMLLEDAAADGPEDFIPDLEKIRAAGRRFLTFIEDIAGFTRAKLGLEGEELAACSTSSAVRSVITDIPALAQDSTSHGSSVRGSLLVVDDNETSRDLMQRQLERQGHIVTVAESGKQALEIMQAHTFDLVLLDIMMPEMSGYQVLQRIKNSNLYGDMPVIVVSALDDMDSVVKCIRTGAEDYLLKPFNPVLLKARIRTCLENKRLKDLSEALELRNLKEEVQLVAESRAMQQVLHTMRSVSRNPVNVLMRGESGTGKEVIARLIHQYSDRKDKPFVAVNCASIPENLMESEFFGYEKGAFTGAVTSRGGYFEEANGGTLFLDEIGDMPPAIQPKFLRVIQEGEGCRLGSAKPVCYDLRIISASNKDLRQEVAAGRFREDLFYRIFSVEIPIPPLRERREDIIPLALFFMNKVCKRFNKKLAGPSPELLSLFEEYPWPGNVRQLLHEVEHMVALAPEGQRISMKHCSEELRKGRNARALALVESTRDLSLAERIEELEITSIQEALRRARGNKVQASKLLGITRQGLDKKLKRYKIG
jgi:DNA-binding NtrC family response regulator